MKPSYWIVPLAAAHLGLVALGAFHCLPLLRLRERGKVGRALTVYSTLSGAGNTFGFFAPGVGSHPRAMFALTSPTQPARSETLEQQVGHEVDLRVGNIIGIFLDHVENKKVRRALAASWAGKVLARHPEAKSVKVRLDTYELPSLDEWAQGMTPSWQPVYEAKFTR